MFDLLETDKQKKLLITMVRKNKFFLYNTYPKIHAKMLYVIQTNTLLKSKRQKLYILNIVWWQQMLYKEAEKDFFYL